MTHKVTPSDREAYLAFNNLPADDRNRVIAGDYDDLTGMQIIAGVRIAERERVLAEVKQWLSAAQYDPAPYSRMKHRLADMEKNDG